MRKVHTAIVLALGLAAGAIAFASPWAHAQSAQAVPPACGKPTHAVTVVGTSAVSVPATPLAGRRWIYVRVSPENTTAATKVKCRMDGTNPTMGAAYVGDVIGVGESILYGFADPAAVVKCISDTAGTTVSTTECTRAY